MTFKDILVPVITLENDAPALEAGAVISQAFGAHAAALIVALHLSSTFSATAHTLSDVLADIAAGSRSAAAREREKVTSWIERAPVRFDIRDATIEDALTYGEVLAHARLADLSICARPAQPNRAHTSLFERIVFGSGRPVLMLPNVHPAPFRWGRILIGWNASIEAMRAITAALPFLQQAEEVTIATVDAVPTAYGHGEAPGSDLARHLARHGVNVTVRNVDGIGRSESAALLDAATSLNADLVVIGAYGRSRASEFLFGGVTRSLLQECTVPLLLAH